MRPWVVLLAAGCLMASCSAGDDVPAPAIGGLVPDHGAPGTAIAIAGSHFCGEPDADGEDPLVCTTAPGVRFGAITTSARDATDDQILVDVPTLAAGDVAVRVDVNARTSNAVTFHVE